MSDPLYGQNVVVCSLRCRDDAARDVLVFLKALQTSEAIERSATLRTSEAVERSAISLGCLTLTLLQFRSADPPFSRVVEASDLERYSET